MTGLRLFTSSALVLVLSAGCQILGGFEDFSENCPAGASACRDGGTGGHVSADAGGSGGSRSTGGAAALGSGGASAGNGGGHVSDGSVEPGRCSQGADPGSQGPPMTQVMRPDGTCFWIDTTEVTVEQYSDFVRAPHPLPEDGVCVWNSQDSTDGGALGSLAFVPPPDCVRRVSGGLALTDGGASKTGDRANHPMTCVDWCDALAFCVWAGKDLCRDDGDFSDQADKSDWYDACTGGRASNLYGCSDACGATACNGASSGLGDVQAVGTIPGCGVIAHDGTTRVRDLSGNVSEWTGWCSPETAEGQCLTRGGNYTSNDATLECGSTVRLPRKTAAPALGFRCCVEPRGSVPVP